MWRLILFLEAVTEYLKKALTYEETYRPQEPPLFSELRYEGKALRTPLAPQFFDYVFQGHQRMLKQHARGGVSHDGLDALLLIPAIAFDGTILAIPPMVIGASTCTVVGELDGCRALLAQSRCVLGHAGMVGAAID